MSRPATPEEWQDAADVAAAKVRQVLRPLASDLMLAAVYPSLALAVAFGAIGAAGGLARALDTSAMTEEWAMATLRGALRGSGEAIHEDGSPYVADAPQRYDA